MTPNVRRIVTLTTVPTVGAPGSVRSPDLVTSALAAMAADKAEGPPSSASASRPRPGAAEPVVKREEDAYRVRPHTPTHPQYCAIA
jgi:hypothetical protein